MWRAGSNASILRLRRYIHSRYLYRLAGTAALLFILVYIIYELFTTPKDRVIFTQPDFLFEFPISIDGQPKCQLKVTDLSSAVELNLSNDMSLENVETTNLEVQAGGSWEPHSCDPWQRVAIIIPYRNRVHHLTILLNRLHPLLRKQQIAYQIFVSQQDGNGPFNRGRISNIAFLEASKIKNFDCIIIHDVDLLPETDNNIYYCDTQARHLASAVDELGYRISYPNTYGGVIALSTANFVKINGFPNRYSGWGGEDDDVSLRTYAAGLLLTRPPYNVGRYKMIPHTKSVRSNSAYRNLAQWKYWMLRDGLSAMSKLKYQIISVNKHKLYTNITSYVGEDFIDEESRVNYHSILGNLWLDLKIIYYLYY